MSEDIREQTKRKKAVLVVLISLAREVENKTAGELETEIRKTLEEGLARIPWLVVENVVVVEE
ncbi:MAG: hypothetical protein OEX77_09370 [Candidatus Bathyarchaeota archaeon]|nr:hypothetical protein [Candidatus Bathyarchaeota archaeon]